jgi:hypothetical protein
MFWNGGPDSANHEPTINSSSQTFLWRGGVSLDLLGGEPQPRTFALQKTDFPLVDIAPGYR